MNTTPDFLGILLMMGFPTLAFMNKLGLEPSLLRKIKIIEQP